MGFNSGFKGLKWGGGEDEMETETQVVPQRSARRQALHVRQCSSLL